MAARIRETELYAPIKRLLEGQGYEVKGEVGAADIVAVRGDEDPVIVELKTAFSLSLFHQAIERQAVGCVDVDAAHDLARTTTDQRRAGLRAAASALRDAAVGRLSSVPVARTIWWN